MTRTPRADCRSLGPWFHNLHLPDGSQTAPDHWLGDFPRYKWRAIAPYLPRDLTGWSAVDIGCNGGYYSVELAQRGADVLAIDIDEHYLDQARWAVNAFGLKDRVTVRKMEVYELGHISQSFDLVLFMGVFYHLRYPLLALDVLAAKTARLLVFQTLTSPEVPVFEPTVNYEFEQRDVLLTPGWPKMAFIEHYFAGDPTNWWVPNRAAVQAMLRSAGFTVTGSPEPETYICQPVAPGHDEFQRQEYRELDAVYGSRPPDMPAGLLPIREKPERPSD